MGHPSVNQRNDATRAASSPIVRSRMPLSGGASLAPASDRRADDLQRTVSLSRDCVRIDRRVQGIAMRVAVPVTAYRGVALTLDTDEAGMPQYGLHLLHRDADLSVTLDCAPDDADIVADWRLWSRFFRLPALVERRAGLIEEADPSLGGLATGKAPATRRAPRFRSKRRPAFLSRRKVGDDGLLALAYRGERELIARD